MFIPAYESHFGKNQDYPLSCKQCLDKLVFFEMQEMAHLIQLTWAKKKEHVSSLNQISNPAPLHRCISQAASSEVAVSLGSMHS